MGRIPSELDRWVASAPRLWLFLDYDGTLADFSPTPDVVEVRPEVVELIRRLASHSNFRVTVISGRTLEIVRKLVPVDGILLAGIYGVEIQLLSGEVVHRENYQRIRPSLNRIKPLWQSLTVGQPGFFIEDKGWSLALHADKAEKRLAREVLPAARRAAEAEPHSGYFRWFSDDTFLEIAPLQAHKGRTVEYMVNRFPFPNSRLVYIGDDDKDEEAFETVHALTGLNILVSNRSRPLHLAEADDILDSPSSVHLWLERLLAYN